METWLIHPRVCSTQLASHLQQYMQRIVWQNAKETWFANESLPERDVVESLATMPVLHSEVESGCGAVNLNVFG